MGRQYGSKAAYEESRMRKSFSDMTEEEHEAQRQREHAHNGRPMLWAFVFGAAINSGKAAQGATQLADQAVSAFDTRFVQPPAGEDEGDEDEA